jgi:replication-associated recombination protein RarA
MCLYRKYRPDSWDYVIGHGKVKRVVAGMATAGTIGGHAFLVTGASGIGKSTIARLVALEICDDDNILDLDASGLTPAAIVDIERSMRSYSIGTKRGRAVTINEVHGMRKDTMRQMLVTLERIPRHCCWALTTTSAGKQLLLDGIDADPLFSRCVPFRLTGSDYMEAFAVRAMAIADAEGLNGYPGHGSINVFRSLVKRCDCNFRAVLSEIEAGACLRETAVTA